MIKQTLLAAAVLMSAMAPTAASAGRPTRANQVEVTQVGNNNAAGVYQIGNNLDTRLEQNGGERTTVVETSRGRQEGRTVIRGKRIYWCPR